MQFRDNTFLYFLLSRDGSPYTADFQLHLGFHNRFRNKSQNVFENTVISLQYRDSGEICYQVIRYSRLSNSRILAREQKVLKRF